MARPGAKTKWKGQETIDAVQDYMDNFDKYGDVVPTHEGLSDQISIARSTLYKWADEPGKEAFSDMLVAIKSRQARLLLSGGLNGSLNSNITKLMLSQHDWIERSENALTGADRGAIKAEWKITVVE